ncbi:16S rRNA (cytosine(1402)-N(4))-methyltransferase RsmH [Polycladidibacter hongkongensis]|uniref:16S rRNA (cytosine(1402)-N(4))-methyltransferase RsmH n=1 Tax=Polycladidibacter hongkongensis TaxID=1647556 RepID=UPI0008316356|nr:16S rRNA (cytosine(1402)-N(4))-methyltransferase RsmH [Pseudovibrio hongkongensis]
MGGDNKLGPGVTGDLDRHIPVLLERVQAAMDAKPGSVIIDGTFGAGGYSSAFLRQGAQVIGIDRDPDAIRDGQKLVAAAKGQLHLMHGAFEDLEAHARACGHEQVDGVVFDLGVSSMQLDQAARGFSFRFDGPLDMRMAQAGPSAADVVNTIDRKDLTRIIGLLGEEKRASSVSHAICQARELKPFETTLELAKVVESVVRRNPKKASIHPATRTFQALRIYVNSELHQAANALAAAERILKPGGRLVVVTFHSLEDRLVKRFLADRCKTRGGGSRHMPEQDVPPATFEYVVKGNQDASDEEVAQNPRARSARLRAGKRTTAAARDLDIYGIGVPHLARFQGLGG